MLPSRTIEEFLQQINDRVAELMREIDAIYPELGRQLYRVQDMKSWAVEQHIIDIRQKDEEIMRLKNLAAAVIDEDKAQDEQTRGVARGCGL